MKITTVILLCVVSSSRSSFSLSSFLDTTFHATNVTQAIRLTHMSKASLSDDEPREGDTQDMTSKIYTIIRDYGEIFLFLQAWEFLDGRGLALRCILKINTVRR